MFETIVSKIRERENALILRKIYNTLVPDFIKNSRWFNRLLFRFFIGSWFDIDFKKKYRNFEKNDWVRLYDELYMNRIRDEDLTPKQNEFIMKNLAGTAIIDVGCGTGMLCERIAHTNKDYVATGCDLSVKAVAEAQERYKNNKQLQFSVEDITELKFSNNQFDTVACCHVIEHIPDFQKSLDEIIRIAKRRIIIIIPEEEFQKFSPDYHVNFFNSRNKLESYFPASVKVVQSILIDGDRGIIADKISSE